MSPEITRLFKAMEQAKRELEQANKSPGHEARATRVYAARIRVTTTTKAYHDAVEAYLVSKEK